MKIEVDESACVGHVLDEELRDGSVDFSGQSCVEVAVGSGKQGEFHPLVVDAQREGLVVRGVEADFIFGTSRVMVVDEEKSARQFQGGMRQLGLYLDGIPDAEVSFEIEVVEAELSVVEEVAVCGDVDRQESRRLGHG